LVGSEAGENHNLGVVVFYAESELTSWPISPCAPGRYSTGICYCSTGTCYVIALLVPVMGDKKR